MAFRSAKQVIEEKYNGKFILKDDGDSADVIFLYQSYDDVLFADTHYIKSSEYNGYVQCLGRNCPVCGCGKNIKVQNKLFIPLYNLSNVDPDTGESKPELQFWDRTTNFEKVLDRDVFRKYPNPSKYVFRIIREGAANDRGTVYHIKAIGSNPNMPYDKLLKELGITMPEAYEKVCKDYSADKLKELLSQGSDSVEDDLPDYAVTPRGTTFASTTPTYDPIPEDTEFDPGDADSDVDNVDF